MAIVNVFMETYIEICWSDIMESTNRRMFIHAEYKHRELALSGLFGLSYSAVLTTV